VPEDCFDEQGLCAKFTNPARQRYGRSMENRSGEMAVFLTVAETGSFSAAARKLALTPSAVSKVIGRLEDRLGVALFVRSTRTIQMTPEGLIYLERVRPILADIEDAERAVASGEGIEPHGRLRVSASVAFGECCLLPVIPAFLECYPRIELDLSLTDTVIDLVEDRTDIAVRSGALRDSTLKARKLLETRRVVVASPEYLVRHGLPQQPHDLLSHRCLRFNFRPALNDWPFRDPVTGETFRLPVTGNAYGNNGVILRQLALSGVGLARLGAFRVTDDLAAGRLLPVLEAFNPGDIEQIHAVYVAHAHMALRVRAFVDFFAATLRHGPPSGFLSPFSQPAG